MATRQRPIDVKALRERLGLSQVELAKRIPVHELTVSRWENGHMQPSAMAREHLKRVEDELTQKEPPDA